MLLLSVLSCLFLSSGLSAKPLQARAKHLAQWNPAGYDTSRLGPSNADCKRQTYQISVEPEISVFSNVLSNANETYLTSLLFEFVTSLPASSNFTQQFLSGGATQTISKTFNISGTFCSPSSGAKDDSLVQLLVHGIGFDSSYWEFQGSGVPEEYSYVYQASAAGYNTFRYDRLGTGLSEHPSDAYNVVQAATDVAILTQIAAGLRSGQLTGQSYSKIAGVGHSYGSVQLNKLAQTVPSAVDAIVLTGYSANSSAVPLYETSTAYSTASTVFPDRFSADEITNAYLVTLAPQTGQLNFLYWPYYTEASAQLTRKTEQPVTQGVLFTFGGLPGVAPSFTGPVHVVTGSKDFIFCLGNCYAVPLGASQASILDYVSNQFPSAKSFSTYIPANCGHGISSHTAAPEAYAEIQKYFQNQGF